MPAFNEAPTIEGVLDDLYPRIDHLVIVDDGSRDNTGAIVDAWASGRDRCKVIHFPENRGLSAALRAGWDEVREMLARGEVAADDVAFSIDADGQHEPAALDGMIDHLVSNGFDCVIGSRDMSYHTGYKKLGNSAMTLIGRLAGGTYFEDIECGYRVFRVGPLLHAQEFYRGYKYSETVEVAVILARMGYKVDNTLPINIPVARTRTRLYDAAVDAVCMPLSWYRLACWREAPPDRRTSLLAWLPVGVFGLTIAALFMMLLKTFYLGDDSAHSYAHVWYLSEALFTRHEWPWHIAQLENGDAVMFPYGIIPWLPDALLYPIFGDWIVTLSMVAGVIFMLYAAGRFRPAMRSPFLLALFLLNPLLWNGITQFQLTSMWSFGLFFVAGGEDRRGRRIPAIVFTALSIAAHPLMGIAAGGLYAAWLAWRERERLRSWIIVLGVAAVLASPSIFLFVSTPLLRDAGLFDIMTSLFDDMRRLSIVVFALALPELQPTIYRRPLRFAGGLGVLTAAILVFLPPSGLWERSHTRFGEFLAQHEVNNGESYRVATKNNHEDGMVEFLNKGAILNSEFFTESQYRKRFNDLGKYRCFLATRKIDHVVLSGEYPQRFYGPEKKQLDALVAAGLAEQEYAGADRTVAYHVHPPPSDAKGSARDCGI